MATDRTGDDDGPSRRDRRKQERETARASVNERLERLESALGFERSRLSGRLDDLDRRLGEADGRAREGYRRQAGFLDVFRRQQGETDQAIEQRLAALEAEVLASSARLAPTESRLQQVESSVASIGEHLGALDTFRGDLGTIIERIGQALTALRDSMESLVARIDTAESVGRQQAAESAEVRERLEADRRLLDTLEQRIAAGEAVLAQRTDLDDQLDRAEAVERLLSEVDPDRYLTRSEFEQFRTAPATPPRSDHSPGGPPPPDHAE